MDMNTLEVLITKDHDKETIEMRRSVCRDCGYKVEGINFAGIKADRCSMCGCFTQTKTAKLSNSCPVGKW